MPTTVTFNGGVYSIPLPGETGWGTNLDTYLQAIATGAAGVGVANTFALTQTFTAAPKLSAGAVLPNGTVLTDVSNGFAQVLNSAATTGGVLLGTNDTNGCLVSLNTSAGDGGLHVGNSAGTLGRPVTALVYTSTTNAAPAYRGPASTYGLGFRNNSTLNLYTAGVSAVEFDASQNAGFVGNVSTTKQLVATATGVPAVANTAGSANGFGFSAGGIPSVYGALAVTGDLTAGGGFARNLEPGFINGNQPMPQFAQQPVINSSGTVTIDTWRWVAPAAGSLTGISAYVVTTSGAVTTITPYKNAYNGAAGTALALKLNISGPGGTNVDGHAWVTALPDSAGNTFAAGDVITIQGNQTSGLGGVDRLCVHLQVEM